MKTTTLHWKRMALPVLLVLLLSAVGLTNAMAQTFTVGNFNYSLNDDGVSVTVIGHVDGTNATGELVIPESVELYGTSYPVTRIGDHAFSGCSGFTGGLTIPNSVTTIGDYAFSDCSGFTGGLTIPNSVTTIGIWAFSYCDGFTGSLVIPDSVTTIQPGTFFQCSGLNGTLTIGNSVTEIGNNAFYYCSGLTGELTIPNSVRTIGVGVFIDCAFTGTLTIGTGVTSMNRSAFRRCTGITEVHWNAVNCTYAGDDVSYPIFNECSNLTTLVFADNVKTIPDFAFVNNSTFTGTLNLPNSLTSIGNYAFSGCSGFTGSLIIPNSLTSIGNYAFSGCSGFTGSLIIPDAVTTIGNQAFFDCTGFSDTLTLGVSLSAIGTSAFFGSCEDFIAFNVLPETPPSLGNNVFLSADYNIPISVSCGASEAYQSASGWSEFTNYQEIDPCRWVILASARPATSGAISGAGTYEQGQTCTLTATSIGDYEFSRWIENGMEVSTDAVYSFIVEGHRNLVAQFTSPNSIVFADPNVEAICLSHWDTDGDEFLSYSEAAAVTDLGNAFQGNTTITSFNEIQYFTGLTTIADYAFQGCINLTSIISALPESVTSIGNWAFNNCSAFTGDLTIPSTITSIGNKAFYNCEGFSGDLLIPEFVTYIGAGAFENCNGFNGVLTIGTSVSEIQDGSFMNTHFSLLNYNAINCSYIGSYDYTYYDYGYEYTSIFFDCTHVNFGDNVESLPAHAFSGCTNIECDIVFSDGLVSIGEKAFKNCISLANILVLPNSLTTIGDQAFYNCYGLEGIVMGNSVETIGSEAFRNCGSIRGELTLPETLLSVGPSAFAGCNEISTVNYNAINCTEMGNARDNVFADCLSLVRLNIGANVQSIPNYAFKPCFLVTDMRVAAEVPPTLCASTFGTISRSIPVSVPYGSGEAYRTAPYWEEFFHITEDYSPNSYTYHWNVNVHQFASNMTVTGIIQIEGVEQAVPSLEIGAFCNGECRGRQLLTYYPQVDRYLVFLMLYGEDGDVFTFRLYDHEAGEELTAGCASVITFEADAIVGSFLDPYVFNFTDMQLTQFSEGWNWWSTYVEQGGIDGLSLLQESLGDNGVAIRSQASGYTDYYAGYGWYGSLESINNESSYRVVTSAPCVAAMPGSVAIPSQHPITLSQGWTWIGYLPSRAMDINTALEGLEATQGDMVKSQQGYSDYYPGYGWFGSLNTIEPGMGLMYYSASGETVTFTYPDNGRGGELKANMTAEHNHWKPNTFAYPDNMTVMAVVELDDAELSSDNYELAAFANGECRGSVKLTYAEPLNSHVAFLTISGKDAAELSFRLYDKETGMEYYDAEESLDFVANAIVGDADDLYIIHFRGTTGMDELASRVQVYPNPVNAGERFSIDVADDVKNPVRVEIVNALGVETLRATSVQTPAQLTAPATAGVYTLRITVEGKGTVVRKLVVK